jgi:hypothetical protein
MSKVREIRQPRPISVRIITILNIIMGIFMLQSGGFFIATGIILSSLPPSAFEDENLTADDFGIDDLSGITASLTRELIAVGSVMIAIGIVSFVVAYGFLKRMGWAWTVTIVLSIINIAFNVITIATVQWQPVWLGSGIILQAAPVDPPPPLPPGAIASMIISGIIIYYLYRPNVKAYFVKAAAARTDASPAAASN